MDTDLYQIMNNILEEKNANNTNDSEFTDIKYVGSITYNEDSKIGDVGITKDVFVLTEKLSNGTTIEKFYKYNTEDNSTTYIGGRGIDGKILGSAIENQDDLSFLSQFEAERETPGLSLKDMDNQIETIAKKLNINKNAIKKMSSADLEQVVEEYENEQDSDEEQLQLNDEQNTPNMQDGSAIKQRNAEILKKNNGFGQTRADQKVDDRHTLGDILGIDNDSKLIAVYSESIANNKNTTRYSFLIQRPDGSLEPADMLEQIGGINSNRTAYDTKLDDPDYMQKEQFTSTYSIKSNSGETKDYVLLIKKGQYGYPEISLGESDRTQPTQVLSRQLKREEQGSDTGEIPIETRDIYSPGKDKDYITETVNEIQECEENGHNHELSTASLDGNLDTVNPTHMLEPNEVDHNVATISANFPSDSPARKHVLEVYLSIVQKYRAQGIESISQEAVLSEVKDELEENMELYEKDVEPEYDESNEHIPEPRSH